MTTLPRLLDCRGIQAELNVKRATAERIMRHCPKVQIGRRWFVAEQEVRDYLRRATSS